MRLPLTLLAFLLFGVAVLVGMQIEGQELAEIDECIRSCFGVFEFVHDDLNDVFGSEVEGVLFEG